MRFRSIDVDITKIDRGVGKGRVSWPFKRMEVNEAVIVSDGDYATIQRRAHSYAAKKGICFITRTTEDGLIIKRIR